MEKGNGVGTQVFEEKRSRKRFRNKEARWPDRVNEGKSIRRQNQTPLGSHKL